MSDDLFDAPDLFAAPPPPAPAAPKHARPRRATSADPLPVAKEPRDPRMKPNPGHCPEEASGKRVIVELANGKLCGVDPVANAIPNGWAASPTKGGPGANWSIRKGWPWNIAYWRLA